MSWLAASLSVVFSSSTPPQNPSIFAQPSTYYTQSTRQTPSRNDTLYAKVLPSVVTIINHGAVTGYGALIGSGGYYVAQNLSVEGGEVQGNFFDGQTVPLKIISRDAVSGLVLLKSDVEPKGAKVASIVESEISPGTPLLVVLQGGSVPARLDSIDRIGVVQPSNRLIPLSEFRFELPSTSLAGSLVFTETGYLVGLISATLTKPQPMQFRKSQALGGLGGGGGGGLGSGTGATFATKPPNAIVKSAYPGPAELTVGYSLGIDVLHRVTAGFLSPSHQVTHASLGLFCRDSLRGAYVTSVQDGSSAAKAGVKAGDVLVGIGKYKIRNQIDFAKVLYRQSPGDEVTVRVERAGQLQILTATLGKNPD